MRINRQTLAGLAKEIIGRDPGGDAVADTVSRLESIIAWVRSVDETRLRGRAPAAVLDLTHPAWHTPLQHEPAWKTVRPTGRGTGYGAPPMATPQDRGTGDDPVASGAPRGPSADRRGFADLPPKGIPATGGLADRTAAELAALIRQGEVSPVEVVRAALERIESLNGELNAFLTITADAALDAAREAERAVASGRDLGPLHGVPVGVKDIIETAGVRTTCGSKLLRDHIPERDAAVVRRLKEAGAIVVGKTNTHEFAFGPTTVNPHYGPCRNPYNPACVSGGSSGGSAVAVATGMVPLALGTDTGGSVRIPAACCGIVGLKPTYGLVSKAGIFPLSWSLDHPGPLAGTAGDAALALAVLAGPDPDDPATVAGRSGPQDYTAAVRRAGDGLGGMVVGVPEGWLEYRVHPAVAAAVEEAVRRLEALGAEVRPVDFPGADAMLLANRLIILAEAAAYHLPTLRSRPEEYGPDVRARLELGQYLPAADYLAGQRLRGELCQAVAAVMREVDLIVTPSLPVTAPYIGQDYLQWADGRETVPDALIRFPAPFNVTGQPAASVPCGLAAGPAGMPVGIQVVGRWFEEGTVLRAAAALAQGGDLRQSLSTGV